MSVNNSEANPMSTQGGGVGGYTYNPQQQPPITAGAYTAGKILGGMMVFPNAFRALSGALSNITVVDKAAQASAMNIYIFRSAPSTSYTNGDTFTLAAADAVNCIGVYAIAAADWTTGGGASVVTVATSGLGMGSETQKTIWVLAVCNGTPTYASASDLIFTLGILQD